MTQRDLDVLRVAQLLGYESTADLPKGTELAIRAALASRTPEAAAQYVRKLLDPRHG